MMLDVKSSFAAMHPVNKFPCYRATLTIGFSLASLVSAGFSRRSAAEKHLGINVAGFLRTF